MCPASFEDQLAYSPSRSAICQCRRTEERTGKRDKVGVAEAVGFVNHAQVQTFQLRFRFRRRGRRCNLPAQISSKMQSEACWTQGCSSSLPTDARSALDSVATVGGVASVNGKATISKKTTRLKRRVAPPTPAGPPVRRPLVIPRIAELLHCCCWFVFLFYGLIFCHGC